MAVKWVKTVRQILITRPKSEEESYGSCSHSMTAGCYAFTQYSTVLPRMPSLHHNARKSWHGALIDQDMERLLEVKWTKHKLNKLYPLKTAGDGNRLLEATCRAMWGLHDISADLKDDLRTSLNDDKLKTRWQNKRQKTKPGYTQAEWDDEWQRVLQRTGLWEDIHVFALAQMLYRPIVVLSEDDQLAGIYLPLDQHPDDCVKTPIVLAYTGYFVPLVSMEPAEDETTLSGVPLVSFGSVQPVIQFLRPEEEPESFGLLQRYMDVTCVPTDGTEWMPAARLNPIKLDPEVDLIDKFCKAYGEEDEGTTSEGSDEEWEIVEMCSSEPRSPPSPALCDYTVDTEEEDTCSYPRCDKLAPEPWWPFCYEHSPDSGLAPGGLIHEYNKWVEESGSRAHGSINEMEVGIEDEMPICVGPMCDEPSDSECNGLCKKCYNTLIGSRRASLSSSSTGFFRRTRSNMLPDNMLPRVRQAEGNSCRCLHEKTTDEEEEEEDNCFYPGCNQLAPERWWPYCYEHSPDSGLAPGGLLHAIKKWEENKPMETEQDDIIEIDNGCGTSKTSTTGSSLPPARSPRCLETGCSLFGDPNLAGYCTRCYDTHMYQSRLV